MSHSNDVEYFRRRTAQEQQRARVADEGLVRRLHLDLASRYAERVREAERIGRPALS